MIYRIAESSKSDEFAKGILKKPPTTNNDEFADKRFRDWSRLSDKEKRKVLDDFSKPKDKAKEQFCVPSSNKYYNANHNSSIKILDDKRIKMTPRIEYESSIFESVKLI